jgi:hypothetical protein
VQRAGKSVYSRKVPSGSTTQQKYLCLRAAEQLAGNTRLTGRLEATNNFRLGHHVQNRKEMAGESEACRCISIPRCVFARRCGVTYEYGHNADGSGGAGTIFSINAGLPPPK